MSLEQKDGLETDRNSGGSNPSPDLNHEMRTYLHTIIGYIELLQEEGAVGGQDTFAADLDMLLMASNELAALVEERLPTSPAAQSRTRVEPTSDSKEKAGKWLRDRIFAPSQQQA